MVKYRAIGPKHACITDGKIYDLTPDGDGFGFLDDEGDERWTLLSVPFHCERFEPVQDGPIVTVTPPEIIPGTHDGVSVMLPDDVVDHMRVTLSLRAPNADQLERAAAVLTTLAGALRDGK